MMNEKGMTLPEILIAVAILTIGLLAVVSMLSAGFTDVVVSGGQSKATSYARQQIEMLKNQPFVATLAATTDTPEAGVTRTWSIAQVGATVAPNRLARITVTVTWQTGASPGQQVIVETMRAE
jgi:prepilin-type N-terminal cleavage/methylation domain-containing protein